MAGFLAAVAHICSKQYSCSIDLKFIRRSDADHHQLHKMQSMLVYAAADVVDPFSCCT